MLDTIPNWHPVFVHFTVTHGTPSHAVITNHRNWAVAILTLFMVLVAVCVLASTA